ncbi:MAG: DUF935 domain-containing protein [Thiobacillaceae bacterium]|jgi:phage gp29-like protein|nr:DUF935 domain-containing protein [Thiobacillaceae bacterium]
MTRPPALARHLAHRARAWLGLAPPPALATPTPPLLARQIATRGRSWDGGGMADWLPNPDPILKATGQDISTYRQLRADAHVGGCIRRRKAAVTGLEFVLEREGAPARVERAIADILADLAATPDADEPGASPGLPALIGEALDGALYGYQPLEITWGRVGSLIVPQVVQGKPPEWFCFDAANQLRFKARDGGAAGELLPSRKFLLARQGATYDNPYGVADLAMCYWPWTFRKAARFWVAWLERYGGDFLIGKLPRSASVTEYADLTASLEAMIQDSVAAIPDDGSVEVLASASKAGSSDAHERFLTYWRGEITIALLGSNQGMETNSTNASATASLEVAQDIRDGDARMIEAVVNQLIRWTCALNWPGADAPVWQLREQEEIDTERPTRDKILVDAGARLTRAYWLRTYDLEEDDLAPDLDPAALDPLSPTPPPRGGRADEAEEEAEEPPALAADQWRDPTAMIDAGPDWAESQVAALGRAAAPVLDDWLARVRRDLDGYISAGRTPADFAAHLLTLYPELPGDDLATIMGEALAAADLAGRYAVTVEEREDGHD